ncbi:MAG: leucine-rich repeat domain-containing protein [Prevotella sp.]|nr:leucine-rich repeat domain-containing protein [Prevotella sp.]
MKQKHFHIFAVLLVLLLPCATWADLKVYDTFEADGITYYVTSTNPLEVSVGNGDGTAIDKETTGAIVIPDDVTGPDNNKYSVTNIAPSSFSGCKGLTAVTIGNSIKKIQYKAFYDCSNLTTFNIPASVTDIGLQAFEKTAWYTNLPDGLIYKDNVLFGYKGKKPEGDLNIVDGTRVIAYSAIFDCDITSVSIPNSVMFIGQQAFQGCYLLKSVTIPNSVKSIGFRAFAESRLTEIHSLMKEPCKLEDEAFRYQYIDAETYYSRVTLYVPAGTKALYEAADGWKEFKNIVEMESEGGALKVNDAFTVNGVSYYVKSVQPMEVAVGVYHTSDNIITAVPQDTTGTIVIPSTVTAPDGNLYTVTSVGYQAFRGCANINSVSLPESITEISPQSFTMCVKLSAINIPNSVNSIGYNAFMNCNELHSVTLPNSITSIGFGAFGWCQNLLEVYSYIEEPFAISSGGMGNAYNPFDYNREGLTLYVPAGTKALYEATDGWKEFKNIVEMVNIDPIEGETTVNTESLNGQDLSDNVVDDVYYNTGDGSYDATDGSIVIGETTNMGQITNAVPGSDDVKNNFTGIILKVAAGKGIIKVNVKTSGNAQLVVQVGNATPMIASKTEQGDVVVNYDVEEDTYVYIYAIIGSSASPSMRASSTDEVRIYGFTVSPGASGVKAVWANEDSKAQIFSLDGKPLNEPQKGVNIVRMSNGQVRKVVVK